MADNGSKGWLQDGAERIVASLPQKSDPQSLGDKTATRFQQAQNPLDQLKSGYDSLMQPIEDLNQELRNKATEFFDPSGTKHSSATGTDVASAVINRMYQSPTGASNPSLTRLADPTQNPAVPIFGAVAENALDVSNVFPEGKIAKIANKISPKELKAVAKMADDAPNPFGKTKVVEARPLDQLFQETTLAYKKLSDHPSFAKVSPESRVKFLTQVAKGNPDAVSMAKKYDMDVGLITNIGKDKVNLDSIMKRLEAKKNK